MTPQKGVLKSGKVYSQADDQEFICDIKTEMNSNGTMFGMCNPGINLYNINIFTLS